MINVPTESLITTKNGDFITILNKMSHRIGTETQPQMAMTNGLVHKQKKVINIIQTLTRSSRVGKKLRQMLKGERNVKQSLEGINQAKTQHLGKRIEHIQNMTCAPDGKF